MRVTGLNPPEGGSDVRVTRGRVTAGSGFSRIRSRPLSPHARFRCLRVMRRLAPAVAAVAAAAAVGMAASCSRRVVSDGARSTRCSSNSTTRRGTTSSARRSCITNAEVPKLAGVIAVRRQQWPVARAKFEEALQRNGADCETSFYLATVLAAQRQWQASVDAFVRTADCLDGAQEELQAEIARLQAPGGSPERQARQIARREQQLAANIRMRATSWFNTAAAFLQPVPPRRGQALRERVIDDPQFGDRARDLLARLPPVRLKCVPCRL